MGLAALSVAFSGCGRMEFDLLPPTTATEDDALTSMDGDAEGPRFDAAADDATTIDMSVIDAAVCVSHSVGVPCNGSLCATTCCYAFGALCVTSCSGNSTPGVEYVRCDGPEDCPGTVCCETADEVQCQASCPSNKTVCHPGCACPGGLTCGPQTPEMYSLCQ